MGETSAESILLMAGALGTVLGTALTVIFKYFERRRVNKSIPAAQRKQLTGQADASLEQVVGTLVDRNIKLSDLRLKERETFDKEIDRLNLSIERLRAESDRQAEELTKTKEEVRTLREQLTAAMSDKAALTRERDELKQKLVAAEKREVLLDRKVGELETLVADLQVQVRAERTARLELFNPIIDRLTGVLNHERQQVQTGTDLGDSAVRAVPGADPDHRPGGRPGAGSDDGGPDHR